MSSEGGPGGLDGRGLLKGTFVATFPVCFDIGVKGSFSGNYSENSSELVAWPVPKTWMKRLLVIKAFAAGAKIEPNI